MPRNNRITSPTVHWMLNECVTGINIRHYDSWQDAQDNKVAAFYDFKTHLLLLTQIEFVSLITYPNRHNNA